MERERKRIEAGIKSEEIKKEWRLIEALRSNSTIRELRLTGQRAAIATNVETALAAMLDGGGASGLVKLGLALRNDAARRTCDRVLFSHMDRQRLQRTGSLQALPAAASPARPPPVAAAPPPPPAASPAAAAVAVPAVPAVPAAEDDTSKGSHQRRKPQSSRVIRSATRRTDLVKSTKDSEWRIVFTGKDCL